MSKHFQRFSESQLVYTFLPKYAGNDDAHSLRVTSRTAAREIVKGDFHFGPVIGSFIKGSGIVHFKRLKDSVVAEKVNDNIKRCYNVIPASRDDIVRQVIALLEEEYPKSVIRLDIESFFSSIDVNKLLKKIVEDALTSFQTLKLLEEELSALAQHGLKGLPRGVSISSTLSEIFMRDIDQQIRRLDGVYYYARFVDDVIIFSTKDAKFVESEVSPILSNAGLHISKKEGKMGAIDLLGDRAVAGEFSYLGYRFFATKPSASKKKIHVDVTMDEKKLNRIKSRIIKAIVVAGRERDFGLLKDRLRFLSGHWPVYYKGVREGKLRGGIGYAYQFLTDHGQLKGLDEFKARALFSSTAFGRKHLSWLSLLEKRELAKISFHKSYVNKRYYGFSASRLTQIMRPFRE